MSVAFNFRFYRLGGVILKVNFNGTEIEYIDCSELIDKEDTFDYLGSDHDNNYELYDIIRDVNTGKIYCTVL